MSDPFQLDFNGNAHAYPLPPPRRLTERQRELLRWMRYMATCQAHVRTGQVRRFYANPHGALRRLEAMGLVHQPQRGRWRATT